MVSFERGNLRAPELLGDFWFNTDPITLWEVRGNVVLIEFWDYSSTNCQRTRHYMKEWYSRYRDFDLVVIGVHTPRFRFGRNPENIESNLKREGIPYPVVMDNDALIWAAYSARMWPTRYLVDRDGFLRFTHQGEGAYEQFDRAIQSLLIEAGYHGLFPDSVEPIRLTDHTGAVCYRPTPEVELGYMKGTIGNPEGYGPESTMLYDDQGFHLRGRVYLKGKWFNERDGMRFEGDAGEEGRVTLAYEALEVTSVMGVEDRRSSRVCVLQDNKPLVRSAAGGDIQFDDQGKSFIDVGAPRLFSLVCNSEFGEHELTLTTKSQGLELYSLSFVTGVIPELLPTN